MFSVQYRDSRCVVHRIDCANLNVLYSRMGHGVFSLQYIETLCEVYSKERRNLCGV